MVLSLRLFLGWWSFPPCWWKAHEVSMTWGRSIRTYLPIVDIHIKRGISLNKHPQDVALNNFQIDTTSLEVRERTIINGDWPDKKEIKIETVTVTSIFFV